jgi:UPF0755 protein
MLRIGLRVGLLVVLLGALAALLLWQEWQRSLDRPVQVPADGLLFRVPPGASMSAVAQGLAAEGVLEHPEYLVWEARRLELAGRVQAGEYRIPPDLRVRELLDLLVSGEVVLHALTVVEGWTFAQLLDAVRADPVLQPTLAPDADGARVMARLGRPDEHPEGRFLPETYHFPRGTTDLELLGRAYRAMADALAEEWAARAPDLPLETPYEALTLASIIEKETGRAAERARIAGVFVRRLQRGMRLQTDPTVIYGMGDAFDGNLRRRDLRTDTPYNTYTRGGLPPTPIALPGRAAIHAALHPADGDALFFVSRGDGSHEFSATLAEHNAAVRRYQLGGRAD